MIEFNNVNFSYGQSDSTRIHALKDINLKIDKNEFIGVIGHTGSGKSTFLQHMNGLLVPNSGEVIVDGISTSEEKRKLVQVRQKVGLVFQYPEYQLFEETIEKDIEFGPKNIGYEGEELKEIVKEAMDMVKLDYETMKDASPFGISGGQQRRVAIAGVIAMKPNYLILDEPTAGLDPGSRESILREINDLYLRNEDLTVLLVSHNMEDIARFAKRIIVIDEGQILMDGDSNYVFSQVEKLEKIGLDIPQITKFMNEYKKKGHVVDSKVLTVEDAFYEMNKYLGGINAK